MSLQIPAIAQIEFDAQIKAAYQKAGLLRPHVRVKTGVVGASTEFRRYNRGVATPRVPQTDVVPMNAGYAKAIAFHSDWNASEYTDKLDQALTNIDERGVLAVNIASAIGRREDQLVIAAMDAANPTANILVGGTGMTFDKIRRASAIFDQRAVPMEKRCMVISARAKEDLLGENRFISSDFVGRRAMETGELPPRLMGFQMLVLEVRDEGGLPLAGTTRTNFAFDSDAVGLAIAVDDPVTVDWIAEKRSWLSSKDFKAGAATIDPLGVVEIETLEA